MASLLVHTTVVPTLTVSAEGVNLKLTMPTSAVAAGTGGTAVVAPGVGAAGVPGADVAVVGGLGVDPAPDALAPQAASATALAAARAAALHGVRLGLCVGSGLARVGSTSSPPCGSLRLLSQGDRRLGYARPRPKTWLPGLSGAGRSASGCRSRCSRVASDGPRLASLRGAPVRRRRRPTARTTLGGRGARRARCGSGDGRGGRGVVTTQRWRRT